MRVDGDWPVDAVGSQDPALRCGSNRFAGKFKRRWEQRPCLPTSSRDGG